MPRRPVSASIGVLLAALVLLAACATESGVGEADGPTPGAGTTPGAAAAGGPNGNGSSVPIVDPASVEAFCALDEQLHQLTDEQIDRTRTADPQTFREELAAFVRDNDAVIDQYVAAAPPEIRDAVNASMDQTRAAVADAALFTELVSGTGDTAAADRVSAFIDVNCPT